MLDDYCLFHDLNPTTVLRWSLDVLGVIPTWTAADHHVLH